MRPISYNGKSFSAANLVAGFLPDREGIDARAQIYDRPGPAGLYAGRSFGGRRLTIEILPLPGNAVLPSLQTALSLLDPANDEPRELQALFDLDGDGTLEATLAVDAVVETYRFIERDEVTALEVELVAVSDTWRRLTYTDPGVFTVSSSPASLALTNSGKARSFPVIRFCMAPGGQRSTGTSTVGWRYRRMLRVTNLTTRDWNGLEPIFLDLGDTTGLVSSGKALANGNDLRVVLYGKMLARTLINWNTGRTFVVVHPEIPAGESVDLEIVYGNASAGAPKTLSDRTTVDGDYCAVDLTGDNGTSTGGNTSTTLNDTGKNWPASYWIGGFLQIVSGTGAGQRRRISANTATQITVERAWTTTPDATSKYCLWRSGWMVHGGIASSATSTSLTDSSLSLATNEFAGGTITILSGTGAGQSRTISTNTATSFTVSPAWTTTPDTTSVYAVERYGHYAWAVGTTDFDAGSLTVRHRGGWQINRFYSKPTQMAFGDFCVGGWQRDTYPVGGNDDWTQLSYVDLGPVGVHNSFFQTGLEARLRRQSPRTYSEEGLGNGVTFISQLGLTGVRFDYRMLNTNSAPGATNGIGDFIVAVRADGNLDWQTILEDSTRRTSFTTVATAFYNLRDPDGNPTQIIMAAIPADGVEVATSAAATDELRVRWNSRLEVQVDPASIQFGALSAEESVYHLAGTLRTGLTASFGHQRLIFGGEGHYVFLGQNTGNVIEVDCENGRVRTYNGGPLSLGGPLLFNREAPWACRILYYPDDPNNDGVLDGRMAPVWLPLPPGASTWYYEEPAIGSVEIQILWREGYMS